MGRSAHEPYPPSRESRFVIGRDAYGHWLVCDQQGLTGGLFTDKASALHFAVTESNHIPGVVCVAPDEAVLSLGPIFEAGFAPAGPQMQGHF